MPTVKDKQTGDVVSRQPYTAEGTQRAEQIAESDPNWEITNAPDTRENYQLGGRIPGEIGFGERPTTRPMDNPSPSPLPIVPGTDVGITPPIVPETPSSLEAIPENPIPNIPLPYKKGGKVSGKKIY
jgi:hypothetical protein